MASHYKKQCKMESKTMDLMISTISEYLGEEVVKGTVHQDLHESTDLVSKAGLKIAVRVRDFDKYGQYISNNDFSIRYETNDSDKSEWHKIFIDGFCDVLFYCWIDASNNVRKLIPVNLDACRTYLGLGILDYKIIPTFGEKNSAAYIKYNDQMIYKRKGE